LATIVISKLRNKNLQSIKHFQKGLIKTGNPNIKDDLLALIKRSMTKITSQDYCGYFNHVREFAVKGIRREDF